MLCGIKWCAFISRKNASRLQKLSKIIVNQDRNTRRELTIDGVPKTWIRKGQLNGWHIEITKETNGFKLMVRGSLHKIYKGNNTGTFTGVEVIAALEEMFTQFDVGPTEAIISYVEVGINIPVPFKVFPYLQDNLLFHKKKMSKRFDEDGRGFEFNYDDYLVKVYEKEQHILRFEVRYKSKDKLGQFRVFNASDLYEPTINSLVDSLLPEWGNLILANGVNIYDKKNRLDGMPYRDREKILEYTSTKYHQDYNTKYKKADQRGKWALQQEMSRLRRSVVQIIEKYGNDDHLKLAEALASGIKSFKETWVEVEA